MKKLITPAPVSKPTVSIAKEPFEPKDSVIYKAIGIINDYSEEFSSMYHGRDPRLPKYEWITVDQVKAIHNHIISKIGGDRGIHNMTDLEYAVKHPTASIVGVDEPTIFERICHCSYLLGKCFVDCGAQVSATVFMVLCDMNHIKVSFNLGQVYDIFLKIIGPEIDLATFTNMLKDHIVPTRKTSSFAYTSL